MQQTSATVHDDLVTGIGFGTSAGPCLPPELEPLPVSRLRFDGSALIDLAVHPGEFWIDAQGVKHIIQHDPDWQPLACAWDAELIRDPGTGLWREKAAADHDPEILASAVASLDALCDQVYTLSPSRVGRYEQKYQEALRYRDAGYPGSVPAGAYPYLVAEAPVRGLTKRELADLIIATAEGFNLFGAAAEAARAELPGAIAQAATLDEKQAAAEALVTHIQTLAQQMEA